MKKFILVFFAALTIFTTGGIIYLTQWKWDTFTTEGKWLLSIFCGLCVYASIMYIWVTRIAFRA